MRLQGRTALIAGSAQGIGAATARRFAAEGASVLLVDIDEDSGAQTTADIVERGGTAAFFRADVSVFSEVEAMVAFALDRFGRLDVLHNNAYALGSGRVGDLEINAWQKTIDVCLTASWYATKVALRTMVEQRAGVIINTASVSALGGDYGLVAYNAAKAGVVNLTRVTAMEYARKGIRCNAICPGPIASRPSPRNPQRRRILEDVAHAIPMGRMGAPEEVANVALFLASDASSFITGASFVVDGGLAAHTSCPNDFGPPGSFPPAEAVAGRSL